MKASYVLSTILLTTAIWIGCADESPSLDLAQRCSLSSECASPLVCAFAKCRQACKASRDCNKGEHCVQSDKPFYICQKQGCSRNSECVGSQVCAVDAQCRDQCLTQKDCLADQVCAAGSCADRDELVNGVLPAVITDAEARCVTATDCPGDLVCLRAGICGAECIVDKDCPRTYSCRPVKLDGPGRCFPPGTEVPDAGTSDASDANASDAKASDASDAADAPDAPPPAPGAVAMTRASGHSTCVLFMGGKVKCFGLNAFGQLGLGDAVYRGDDPGEMGDALPYVDLGTARTAKSLAVGEFHVCALLDDNRVKCWGANDYGELGLGDVTVRGDGAGEMGDNLPFVDLGAGRTAKMLTAGVEHTCAILDNDGVKCWGGNDFGQLGIGDVARRGDGPGEMGDTLPYVDLGTGRTAKAIAAGAYHTCALLDTDQVKCWGYNDQGQLGLGDVQRRGDAPGEMGNALPILDFGAGRFVKTIATSALTHTCAILDNNRVKCWGDNGSGVLGLGDVQSRGDGPGEMGDSLPYVDLGTGRTAKAITPGGVHTCAILDNDRVKCWGRNLQGRLGLGDALDRGSAAGQMGDLLPYVDLGTGRLGKSISANKNHTCAVLDDDRLKCWGHNLNGQLGLGDVIDRGSAAGQMGDALPSVKLVGP